MRFLGISFAVFLGLSFPVSAAQIKAVDVPESALAPFVVHSTPEAGDTAQPPRRARPADRLIERASAVDGTQYAVVAPIFTSGNVSYLRLFNGQGLPGFTSKSTTFAVGVVGSPSGTLYGTAQIAVPALASKQVAISEILSLASVAGLSGSDTGYSLFIQNTDLVGFQHIIFNQSNGFFENVSTCSQGYLNNAGDSLQVLNNVHTSRLATYPAYVSVSNFQATAATYQVTMVDAATGATVGIMNLSTAANASYLLPMTFFEQQASWSPTAAQLHANLIIQAAGSSAVVGQFVVNQTYNAYLNMSVGCLVGNYVEAGGGGTTFPAVGANGIYKGLESSGRGVLGMIGASGDYWFFTFQTVNPGTDITGIHWGTGTSASGTFTSASARVAYPVPATQQADFPLLPANGYVNSGSWTLQYVQGQNLSGTMSYSVPTNVSNAFAGTISFTRIDYDPTSLTAPALSQIAGTYRGTVSTSTATPSSAPNGWTPSPTLIISPTGAISGTLGCSSTPFGTSATAVCSIAGTITPRSDIRAYDVNLSFPTSGGGSVSQVLTTLPYTGMAYFDTVLNRLTLGTRTSANGVFVFNSTSKN